MISITDENDPRILRFRSLKDRPSQTSSPICIAEGVKTVRAAIESDQKIVSIFVEPSYLESHPDLFLRARCSPENILTATREFMTKIVGFEMHQGIMAAVEAPRGIDESEITFPCLVLNGIADSENVGALMRVACAFGWHSIVIDQATVSPLVRRAVRVSMGTVFSLRIHRSTDIPSLLMQLRHQSDAHIIAAEITPNSLPLSSICFEDRTILVIGSEGHGIHNDILKVCDRIVHIPMHPSVPSLNVATAASVFCYAHSLQRTPNSTSRDVP